MKSGKQTNSDEPKAILNSDERKMLRGEDEVADELRWKRHSRIRKRLQWAIYDFWLIYDNWDEINLDKAFEEQDPRDLLEGGTRAISTLYRGMDDSQVSFKSALADGIWRAESDMNDRYVDVRFGVEAKEPGNVYVSDAARRVNPEEVDSLRIPEMRAVLDSLAKSGVDVSELHPGTHVDEMIDHKDDE